MADNVTVDNGGLTDYVVASDDDGTAEHQYVKVEFGGDGTFTKVTSAVGLPVGDAGGSLTVDDGGLTLSIDDGAGSLTVDGTVAVSGTVAVTDNSGSLTVDYATTGSGTATGALRVELPTNGTGVLATVGTITNVVHVDDNSGSLTVDASNLSTNIAQMNGVATTMGNGVSGTGVQRVTVASDSTGVLGATQSGTWTVQPGNTANTTAWKVDGSAVTQPVSGTVGITANSSVNVAQINGVTTTMGNGVSGTGVQRVTLASDSTGQVALAAGAATIGALTANQSVNAAQINGVAPSMGNGASGTGVQRVTLANDSTGVVSLATGANTIGALTANQSTNIAQMNGVATTMGNGASGTGVQRVTIASDSTGVIAVTESGTWTVQPGNTPNSTPWLTTNTPATSGGWSTFMASSADGSTALTSTAQAAKASAGQVGGWYIYNPNATVAYVIFYNVAQGSVTVGTTNPQMAIAIPATSAANVEFANGIAFSTAITVAATTTGGGNTAPSSALEANIFYK